MEAKIRNLHGQQNPSPSSQQNPQNPAQIQQNPPQAKRNPPPAKQNHLHAKQQIPPKKAMPRNPQEQKNVVKEEAKMLQKGPRGSN
jgi:hypothetical protein